MELRGKVCVVTGGSTGIGRALAVCLGSAGCRVALCARDQRELSAAAGQVREAGGEALAVTADISREEDVSRLAAIVHDSFGPVDVLVNNAGIGAFGPFHEMTIADFDRVFAVNVRGLVLCSLAFAPAMAARGEGVIVNVASIAGKMAFAGGSVYAGSKHAVMGISRAMMLDLRPHGVRVLTVCPGSVGTPFFVKVGQPAPAAGKVLKAEDVAELVVAAIAASDRVTTSELEIRPVNP